MLNCRLTLIFWNDAAVPGCNVQLRNCEFVDNGCEDFGKAGSVRHISTSAR
jgi:hypothetical protein